MGSVKLKFNGVEHDVNDSYTFLESPSSVVLLQRVPEVRGGELTYDLRAVGGAYYNRGGGGRWITAKFGNSHLLPDVDPKFQDSDVRGWVITERQSSINSVNTRQVRHELGKLFALSKGFVEGTAPPDPLPQKAHDVTYSDALWDV